MKPWNCDGGHLFDFILQYIVFTFFVLPIQLVGITCVVSFVITMFYFAEPGISEITDLKKCDNYPSSRFFVSWKKVEKCDMYEITVTSKSLDKVEAVLRQEGHLQTQSWYSCLRPGDEYSVTVTCSYNSILGNRSTKKTIQLGKLEQVP